MYIGACTCVCSVCITFYTEHLLENFSQEVKGFYGFYDIQDWHNVLYFVQFCLFSIFCLSSLSLGGLTSKPNNKNYTKIEKFSGKELEIHCKRLRTYHDK